MGLDWTHVSSIRVQNGNTCPIWVPCEHACRALQHLLLGYTVHDQTRKKSCHSERGLEAVHFSLWSMDGTLTRKGMLDKLKTVHPGLIFIAPLGWRWSITQILAHDKPTLTKV